MHTHAHAHILRRRSPRQLPSPPWPLHACTPVCKSACRRHVSPHRSTPRRSAWSNKLIEAKDHGSVQINVGHLDADGKYINGSYSTFAIRGAIRAMVSAGVGGGAGRGEQLCACVHAGTLTHACMHARKHGHMEVLGMRAGRRGPQAACVARHGGTHARMHTQACTHARSMACGCWLLAASAGCQRVAAAAAALAAAARRLHSHPIPKHERWHAGAGRAMVTALEHAPCEGACAHPCVHACTQAPSRCCCI